MTITYFAFVLKNPNLPGYTVEVLSKDSFKDELPKLGDVYGVGIAGTMEEAVIAGKNARDILMLSKNPRPYTSEQLNELLE